MDVPGKRDRLPVHYGFAVQRNGLNDVLRYTPCPRDSSARMAVIEPERHPFRIEKLAVLLVHQTTDQWHGCLHVFVENNLSDVVKQARDKRFGAIVVPGHFRDNLCCHCACNRMAPEILRRHSIARQTSIQRVSRGGGHDARTKRFRPEQEHCLSNRSDRTRQAKAWRVCGFDYTRAEAQISIDDIYNLSCRNKVPVGHLQNAHDDGG